MRDHAHHIEVTREEAVRRLLDACAFAKEREYVPLENSVGRVLSDDVVAQLDLPNCLTCRMDSIAVRWSDFAQGMPDTSAWQRGVQWEFANTGVAMPAGFDTAIVVEHACVSDDEQSVSFDAAPSRQFAGTSEVGSRMRAGDVVAQAGQVITPALAAEIASGGAARVPVIRRPRVAFIPTGNELVPFGTPLPPGKNYETNSLIIGGKITAWGGDPLVFDIVPDDRALIVEAVRTACAQADIVVLNAGSSKGSDDWNVEMLDEIGTVLYHQTNHGPGHHSSGAVVDGVPVVGISGPPRGAGFTTDFYLWPVMRRYFGLPTEPQRVWVRLAEAFPKGGPGGPKRHDAPLAGEDKPLEALDGSTFYGIKMLLVTQAADGVLEGRPFPGMPGGAGSEAMNAYYALPQGINDVPPQPGDMIEVELRP